MCQMGAIFRVSMSFNMSDKSPAVPPFSLRDDLKQISAPVYAGLAAGASPKDMPAFTARPQSQIYSYGTG